MDNQEDLWTVVRTLVKHVRHNWRSEDAGIWEIRGERKHFVFSKVLSWVAVDRAVKIAEIFGKTEYIEEWNEIAARISEDVIERGWNEKVGAFTQAYGDTNLDASNLLIAHYGFLAADDWRYVSTVKATHKTLCHNGMMFRYINEDDFGRPDTSFIVCTFWMIKSLFMIGERKEARAMFENILAHRNHLGLLSEDMEFESKRLTGNFPQAYSHLALIDCALTLSRSHTEDWSADAEETQQA